ncbi:MAG TPA: AMP-binding protein, partial [Erythrobacter sp.]
MLQTMPHQPDPLPRPLDHLAELAGAAGRGESPALVLREGTLNHNQLRLRVARLAGWLAREVPEKGARVASWAAKGELTCLMPLAAARAGLVHVPINPLLKRAQAAHILADSGALMLLTGVGRAATLEPGDLPEDCTLVLERDVPFVGEPLPPGDADPES